MSEALGELQKAAAARFENHFEQWRERFAPGLEMEIARGIAWRFFMWGCMYAAYDIRGRVDGFAELLALYEGLRFHEAPPPARDLIPDGHQRR